MNRDRRTLLEDLCWEIVFEGDSDGDVEAPSEEILEAYRARLLSSDEASELEHRLAQSQAARRKLAALAGVEMPAPLAELRERVLGELEAPRHASACAGGVSAASLLSSVWVKS